MPNGKVCTGFSKPWVAQYNANAGVITYTGARPLARGVSVSIDPESSDDNNFYSDNVLSESASGVFTGGTATLTVDGLFTAAERFIMGLPEPGADGFTPYGDNQQAPEMGVGFIVRYMSGGVTTYVPTILVKTKFQVPTTEAATQEEEIDWQTQELNATIMRGDDSNHNWKYVGADYSTEEEAENALKTKLGYVAPITLTLSRNNNIFDVYVNNEAVEWTGGGAYGNNAEATVGLNDIIRIFADCTVTEEQGTEINLWKNTEGAPSTPATDLGNGNTVTCTMRASDLSADGTISIGFNGSSATKGGTGSGYYYLNTEGSADNFSFAFSTAN